MNDDQNKGFEIGESTSVMDFVRTKLRGKYGGGNGKIINASNPDVN